MFYLVIPTINGEINDYASLYTDLSMLLKEVNYESIVYVIDTINQLLTETDIYELEKLT